MTNKTRNCSQTTITARINK